jgi:hypothetical protein
LCTYGHGSAWITKVHVGASELVATVYLLTYLLSVIRRRGLIW